MPQPPANASGTIFVVCLLAAYYLLRHVLSGFKSRHVSKEPANRVRLPLQRPPRRFGLSMLTWQAFLLAFIGFDYLRQGWNPASVGLVSNVPPIAAFGFGALCYGAFILCMNCTFKAIGLARVLKNVTPVIMTIAKLWPRGRVNKKLAFLAFVLNPITEELLFRGILVYQFSLLTGSVAIPLIVGLSAMIATHLYQGWPAILTGHIPMYGVMVALLFSPMGLAAAIGFHMLGDLVPVLSLKRYIRMYRNQNRRTGMVQLAPGQKFDSDVPSQ